MKNIVIIGTGAVAAEITSYIEDFHIGLDQNLLIKGYIDYKESIKNYWGKYNLQKPVLGDIDSYSIAEDDNFVIGIGNVENRKKMIDKIKSRRGKFLNIIHPTSIIARTAIIGQGNIIYPYCMIGPNVIIGDFNLLTSQSIVSHNSVLGFNNFLATSLLCGYVKVGDNNTFGIRSTVMPNVTIGNTNIIQAGMIVDRNVSNCSTVFHRFKEKIIAIPK